MKGEVGKIIWFGACPHCGKSILLDKLQGEKKLRMGKVYTWAEIDKLLSDGDISSDARSEKRAGSRQVIDGSAVKHWNQFKKICFQNNNGFCNLTNLEKKCEYDICNWKTDFLMPEKLKDFCGACGQDISHKLIKPERRK